MTLKKNILEMEEFVMLCQFSVKNYKSIRDEITFDMQAAAISEHTDRVIKSSDGQLFLSDNHESVLSKKSKIGRRLD